MAVDQKLRTCQLKESKRAEEDRAILAFMEITHFLLGGWLPLCLSPTWLTGQSLLHQHQEHSKGFQGLSYLPSLMTFSFLSISIHSYSIHFYPFPSVEKRFVLRATAYFHQKRSLKPHTRMWRKWPHFFSFTYYQSFIFSYYIPSTWLKT